MSAWSFFVLIQYGYANLHAARGALGSNVIGGLIFGAGFALRGYCPGTVAGAVRTGALDALFGGMVGMLIGAGIFAELYPALQAGILNYAPLPAVTIPELLRTNTLVTIVLLEAGMVFCCCWNMPAFRPAPAFFSSGRRGKPVTCVHGHILDPRTARSIRCVRQEAAPR